LDAQSETDPVSDPLMTAVTENPYSWRMLNPGVLKLAESVPLTAGNSCMLPDKNVGVVAITVGADWKGVASVFPKSSGFEDTMC
jgi:hypothetical protein